MSTVTGHFGAYDIVRPIARGGMAEILLATNDRWGGLERQCVIKRIREPYTSDVQFISLFIDEARITIGLDHRNIVRLYDFGQIDSVYYMAMEYVSGSDLHALWKGCRSRGIRLKQGVAIHIITEILSGLGHAHQKRDHNGELLGLVHRDVSPHNVLLAHDGTVKLTDFGIAAAKNKITPTTPGTVLGKSAYMSPEQARGEKVDRRTDLFAAGVMLFELLTNERLFASGDGNTATLHNLFHKDIPLPSTRHHGLDRRLDAILKRALSRDRQYRYADAEEMRSDLLGVAADHPAGENEVAKALAELEYADKTFSLRPALGRQSAEDIVELSTLVRVGDKGDKEVAELFAQLQQTPDLWTLVALGDRYVALDEIEKAMRAFRCAAAIFAFKGRLVEAICAYHGTKRILGEREREDDLMALGDIEPGSREDLKGLVARFGVNALFDDLQAMATDAFAGSGGGRAYAPTPLFGYLAPREFARLALDIKVRRIPVGRKIIEEGQRGDSLFAIGHGRSAVYCRPSKMVKSVTSVTNRRDPEKVYLSALSDGDIFGEFSFLTGRPRSATVESITTCRVLEIEQHVFDRTFAMDPAFTEPLLRFYKERIVDLQMAKSAAFFMLRPPERRRLLSSAEHVAFDDNAYVIRQGDDADSLFFIKQGEVEVFRVEDEASIFINKLTAGDFFGERGVITGEPRVMNVRTMGECELFRIPRKILDEIINREPDLAATMRHTIASRDQEASARVHEHRLLFRET